MDYSKLLNSLDTETCGRLRRALELGKWPDGRILSREQKELCMQAVIAFDHRILAENERVGYIEGGTKGSPAVEQTQTLNWADSSGPDERGTK